MQTAARSSHLFLFISASCCLSDGTDIKDESDVWDGLFLVFLSFFLFSFSFFSLLSISVTQGNMEAVWPRIIYQDLFFFFFLSLSSLSKWLVCGETVEPPSQAIRPPSTSPCGERKIRENWKWRGKRRRERDHCFSTSLSLPLSLLWAWLAAKLKRLVINLGDDGSSSATGLDWWRRGWRLFLSVCVCVEEVAYIFLSDVESR